MDMQPDRLKRQTYIQTDKETYRQHMDGQAYPFNHRITAHIHILYSSNSLLRTLVFIHTLSYTWQAVVTVELCWDGEALGTVCTQTTATVQCHCVCVCVCVCKDNLSYICHNSMPNCVCQTNGFSLQHINVTCAHLFNVRESWQIVWIGDGCVGQYMPHMMGD